MIEALFPLILLMILIIAIVGGFIVAFITIVRRLEWPTKIIFTTKGMKRPAKAKSAARKRR